MANIVERLRFDAVRCELQFSKGVAGNIEEAVAIIERLRAAIAPFVRYYDDIRFNLRKQPSPTDSAIFEQGERNACVTWAEFYALRDAMRAAEQRGPSKEWCEAAAKREGDSEVGAGLTARDPEQKGPTK